MGKGINKSIKSVAGEDKVTKGTDVGNYSSVKTPRSSWEG